MLEEEMASESKDTIKQKIRARYKGVDRDILEFIPARPVAKLYDDASYKRVCAYCRVSTGDPHQTTSYELQKNYYEDKINSAPNWSMVGLYADEGISGTSLMHREEFKKMIRDCEAGKIDLILTKSVSRFARNIVDCLEIVRELKRLPNPVGVLFETEGIYTLDGTQGEMMLSVMAMTAQEESQNKSDIMNQSIEMRFSRGIFLTPELLGYDKDADGNLVINEDEADTVRLAYYLYDGGFSKTYRRKTGIAGYTLIFGSRSMELAEHELSTSGEEIAPAEEPGLRRSAAAHRPRAPLRHGGACAA